MGGLGSSSVEQEEIFCLGLNDDELWEMCLARPGTSAFPCRNGRDGAGC